MWAQTAVYVSGEKLLLSTHGMLPFTAYGESASACLPSPGSTKAGGNLSNFDRLLGIEFTVWEIVK